jgi:hypothetical protein
MIKKTKSEVFASVFFDRSTNNIALQILAVFSIIFIIIFQELSTGIIKKLVALLIILIVWLVIRLNYWKKVNMSNKKFIKGLIKITYYISSKIKQKFQYDSAFQLYVNDRLERYSNVFFKFNNDKRVFRAQIFYGLFFWILLHLSTYFLFKSTGTNVSLLSVIIVQTIALAIGAISFFPGGIGITESVMIGLYYSMGILPSIAATVAFLNRIISYFYEIVIGPIFIYILNKRYSKKKFEIEI